MRTISSDIDSYSYFLQIGNALWIGEDGLDLLPPEGEIGDAEEAGIENAGDDTPSDSAAGSAPAG
jgi:hypothetical protein